MPIDGRTLGEAARTFCNHLNEVLARTVTQSRLVLLGPREGERVQVAFRERGGPAAAPLRTVFGLMGLYLGQVCTAIPMGAGQQRLITVRYRYTLTPERSEEPLWRWEYVREWPDDTARWCRHHVQGNVALPLGPTAVTLNDLHLPTGYVTIEDILRFCIVDLGVRPLSDNWHDVLEESYRRFREDFAPRGYI